MILGEMVFAEATRPAEETCRSCYLPIVFRPVGRATAWVTAIEKDATCPYSFGGSHRPAQVD
jgi:hypothetical protein